MSEADARLAGNDGEMRQLSNYEKRRRRMLRAIGCVVLVLILIGILVVFGVLDIFF